VEEKEKKGEKQNPNKGGKPNENPENQIEKRMEEF